MNKNILYLLFIIITPVFGYTPSADSLFRNGSNQDLGTNTTVGLFKIEKKVSVNLELEGRPLRSAIKILLGNDELERKKMIQLDYRDGIISDTTMNRIHFKNKLSLEALKLIQTNQVEAAVFYSLMTTLLSNDSSLFTELLKSYEPNYNDNKELINKDQNMLLRKYKIYISKTAEDENQNEFKNPLEGSSTEEKEMIQKIMADGFLNKDKKIKRVRENNKFFWDFVGEKVYARFDGETHKLKKFTLTTTEGKIEVDCYNYILFNASMEFPEVIYFKDLSGQMYEIKMSKLYIIKESPGSFGRRLKNYEKTLNNNSERNSDIVKPAFLI